MAANGSQQLPARSRAVLDARDRGLIASTVVVAWTASATESWSPGLRSMVLPFANLATFGALWIVQFVLLERVIFREDRGPLGVLG